MFIKDLTVVRRGFAKPVQTHINITVRIRQVRHTLWGHNQGTLRL